MIPLSGRYLVPVVALLALALVPVAARHAGGRLDDSCAVPAGLYEVSEIPNSQFERQHPAPGRWVSRVIQWSQGSLETKLPAGASPLKFDVIRSYSSLDLYAWSRNVLTPDYYVTPVDITSVDAGGEVLPVMIHRNADEGFAAMLFLDAGRPTANPIASSLRRALRNPLAPATTSTIFSVRTPNPLGDARFREEDATRWLRDAWLFYRATCIP